MNQESIKILASQAMSAKLNRRMFLAGGLAGIGAVMLAGCSPQTSGSGGSGSAGQLSDELGIYSFPSYSSPDVIKTFSAKNGPRVTIDSFTSAEEMVAKLSAAQGTTGYDLVTSPSAYVLPLGEKGVFQKLDHDRLSNYSKLNPSLMGRSFDPSNSYSIPKATGSTGFAYDNTKISRKLETWADFLDAGANEASGRMSMIDDARTMTGPYFWANGLDWNTENKAHLKACQDFFVKYGSNIKYFDTSVGTSGKMNSGELDLVQGFNGDLRMGLLNEKNPERWTFVFPDISEVWIDNWALASGAPNEDAAYAYLDFLLEPKNALAEVDYLGYDTGVLGVAEEAAMSNATKYPELMFFTPEQMSKWTLSEVNSGRQTLVDVWNETKSAAGA
ncbi:spermidine/putrescine ABC transporter substrate-binding protein [Leucobacter alluvii]